MNYNVILFLTDQNMLMSEPTLSLSTIRVFNVICCSCLGEMSSLLEMRQDIRGDRQEKFIHKVT